MSSTTDSVAEDANTYFEDALASTELNAKMANTSHLHLHQPVDGRLRPVIERSVSASNVDFIMMREARQPATAQKCYEAGTTLTAASPFLSKGATKVVIAFIT